MKQIVILGLVAFLCAIGGATWFTAYLAPDRARPAEAGPPGPIVPGRTIPAAAAPAKPKRSDSRVEKHADSVGKKATADSGRAVQAMAPADTAPHRRVAPIDSAALIRGAKSVAKVVASMKPKDAVGILSRLSDEEVERIVRQLNPKQIAALLAAFPEERAAGLSRKLLGPRA